MSKLVSFSLCGMDFEYDEEKNQKNILKHGIPFKIAARVFFDYERIELYDESHSEDEERYDTIGDTSAGVIAENRNSVVGNFDQSIGMVNDILFVVYTERKRMNSNGKLTDVTRIISARLATSFERGLYYGKHGYYE